ncbi:MAG: hypothetical protein WBJ21_04055, partial [Burkholderiaceae bacterium]
TGLHNTLQKNKKSIDCIQSVTHPSGTVASLIHFFHAPIVGSKHSHPNNGAPLWRLRQHAP